jgi:hypothetical protein
MSDTRTLAEKLHGRRIRQELDVERNLKSLMWRLDISTLPRINPVDVLVTREDLNTLMASACPEPPA